MKDTKMNRMSISAKKARMVAVLVGAVSAIPAMPALAQTAQTIAQMEGDANNTPNQAIDTSTITAIVSQGGGLISDGYTYTNWSFLANDGTGSLDVFGKMPTSSTYTPTLGDEITATGTYYPFRNTPELETLTAISQVGTASSIASPTVVTVPQLLQLANTGTTTNSNPIQGYLLQLNDVTFSGLEDQTSGNTPETTMTQHANNQWTATDSSGNSILFYQYASSYSVAGALALQNGGALPTTAQDVLGLAQVYNGTAEFIPLSYSNSTNIAPPPPANHTILTPSPFASQTQGSATTAGILSVGTSGSTKTVTANVGTWVNVGTAANPQYEFATIPNESVLTSLQLASTGGTVGTDVTYFASVANGAHGFPAANYPIPTGQTGTANIGFSASDTGVAAGTQLTGSLQITNSDNLSDSPISVTVNASSPLHVLAQRNLDAGLATAPVNVGDVLVGATGTSAGEVQTTNTNGDYTSNSLTTVTVLANGVSASYTQKDPFTSANAATITASAPGYDQVFGGPGQQQFGAYDDNGNYNQNGGVINVSVTPITSGQYGDDLTRTVGSTTNTYAATYASFAGTSEGVVGMGLPGEDESIYAYAGYAGFQPASVTASGSIGSVNGVTLTNAASTDNIAVVNGASASFGLRASAWITSNTANQDGWSTNLTNAVAGGAGSEDQSGSTIPGTEYSGTSGNDTTAHTTTVSFTYNPSSALAGSYTGGTFTIGLENAESDDQGVVDGGPIQGTSHNDLAPVTLALPNETGTGDGSGTYNFGGGIFTASGATNLTGSFTQTGGTANFKQITGGSVIVSGGTLKLASSPAAISALGSLTLSGGTVDLTNNEITVTDSTGSAAALVAALTTGYDSGKWDGKGIISSTAASTPGTSVGYNDNGTVTTIRYTWLGDLDLDGSVTEADVTAMGKIPTTGPEAGQIGWFDGDLNYDGKINQDDYALLALGAAEAGSKALSVPEPMALSALILPALLGIRRRRA